MDSMVRRVLARYFERPGEYPPDQDMSWMEYLEDKTKFYTDPGNVVKEMMKNKKTLEAPYNITNPYEYENPSDAPKDQKDSPPFENIIDEPTMFGIFNRPNVFGEQGELKEWYNSRREDWTTDEDEQQPAISITRKRLASEGVPEDYLSGFTVSGSEFFDFMMRSKVAASLNEIVDKDFHYKNNLKLQRSDRCTVVWANKNNPNQFEKGLFIFKVSSPGSKFRYHNVYFQFLRDENKAGQDGYVDYPVHIGCTCPSFLYSGAQYYAVKDGYMYMPAFKPDLVAPKMQNQYTIHISPEYPKGKHFPGRGLNSRVCKHILAAYEDLKKYKIVFKYKEYPLYSPPSGKIDSAAWEKMIGFPFTEEEIKKRLTSYSPVVPAYFNRESMLPAVIDWFKNTWFPMSDYEKAKALKKFRMFPERIFFILIEEAYLKRQQKENISERLVDIGYKMMDSVIQSNNPSKGQVTPENDDGQLGTGKVDVINTDLNQGPEDEEPEDIEKPAEKQKRKTKQYGVGEKPERKVKQPGRLKRPTTVKPAIK